MYHTSPGKAVFNRCETDVRYDFYSTETYFMFRFDSVFECPSCLPYVQFCADCHIVIARAHVVAVSLDLCAYKQFLAFAGALADRAVAETHVEIFNTTIRIVCNEANVGAL